MKRCRGAAIVGVCILLVGCGHTDTVTNTQDTEIEADATVAADTEIATDTGTSDIVLPTEREGYRKRSETLPDVSEPIENPGTRAHCTFTSGDQTYIFTETENLWLYNQSKVYDLQTEFMLNVDGYKVGITIPDTQPDLQQLVSVYTDQTVTLYRQQEGEVAENEQMYLTVYDLTYQVENWAELVRSDVVKADALYQALAQMGTAVTPADAQETLTDAITGLRMTAVLEDYKLAYREGMTYSAFLCCSPFTNEANHDNFSIYLSMEIPDWETYAILHFEAIPDYQERLEDTGETYDGHKILADYTGELKYFLLGEDGRCVYLEGVPDSEKENVRSYTDKEAAYIFSLAFTKE